MSVVNPTEIKPTVAHIRIVFKDRRRGTKFGAWQGRVFITFPGMEEFEFPGVRDVAPHYPIDGATGVTLELIATTEVVYE